MKFFRYLILPTQTLLLIGKGITHAAYQIYPSTFAAFDCGGGSSTATGYTNWASIGQGIIEDSQSSSYKNYAGYIRGQFN